MTYNKQQYLGTSGVGGGSAGVNIKDFSNVTAGTQSTGLGTTGKDLGQGKDLSLTGPSAEVPINKDRDMKNEQRDIREGDLSGQNIYGQTQTNRQDLPGGLQPGSMSGSQY